MKRIITTIFAATLLLTGCGQVSENAGADISDSELYTDAKYNSTTDDVNNANDDTNDISINVVFKGNPIDISDTQDALMDMSEDIINTYCVVGLELQEALYSDKINQYSSEGCIIQIQYPSPKTFELKWINDTKSLEISKATILINTENNNSCIGIVCDANEKVYHLSDESAKMIVKYLTDISSADTQNSNSSENTSDIQINTQSNAEKDNIMSKQLWKILIIKEVPTSNYTQKITVVDESGTIYRYNYSDVNESFHIYAENWQEQLADICSSSNTAERLSDDDIKIFAEYMENIYKYREENIMTQKSQLKDYGVTVVYGIDYNNDNPEYTLICKYGSEISCIDNSITKKFANKLIQLNLLYTMGYTFE